MMTAINLLLPLEKLVNRPDIPIEKGNWNDKAISEDILILILSNLNSQSLSSCDLVCKEWNNLTYHDPQFVNDRLWNHVIAQEIHQCASFVFGREEWLKYYGDVGNPPNYPRNICKILSSNCPFFNGQAVGKTHMFVLVPETVNGNPLTLHLMGELVKSPKEGLKTGYSNCTYEKIYDMDDKTLISKVHWMLITNGVIPISSANSYALQQKLKNKQFHYNSPNVLEAVLTVFIKYVSSGEYQIGQNPWIFMTCQMDADRNHPVVGGFGPAGLMVYHAIHVAESNFATLGCRNFNQ